MNDQSRALVHAITGPIILITVGSLFALDKFSGYPFRQTWPVLIIVIGMLKLFGGSRRRNRYAAAAAAGYPAANQPAGPPPYSAAPPFTAQPPYTPPAPPSSGVRPPGARQ